MTLLTFYTSFTSMEHHLSYDNFYATFKLCLDCNTSVLFVCSWYWIWDDIFMLNYVKGYMDQNENISYSFEYPGFHSVPLYNG